MFYAGILACAALPFLLPVIVETLEYPSYRVNLYTAVLLPSGICTVYILYQLKAMFKTLVGGEPFVEKNVSCLRKCGMASFALAVIFLIRIILEFTVTSVFIIAIFAVLGLFSLTLKDLFKQAVFYKEENDWTV
jgi:hypothetical protein